MKCLSCGVSFKGTLQNKTGLCDYCKVLEDEVKTKDFGLLDEPDIKDILNPTGRTQPKFYD